MWLCRSGSMSWSMAASMGLFKDRLPRDELARAAISHQVDDAFAVDADLLEEFVFAAFGIRTVGEVAFTCWISGGGEMHQRGAS